MTKMRNVGGIAQTEAQKSSDLFMKCRYLDELTGGRGIDFCHRHPHLQQYGGALHHPAVFAVRAVAGTWACSHFDDWAANFGETVTAIELSPEGYTLVGR